MPDHHPQRMNLLVIGQSHIAAIRAAARTHRETYPDEPRTRVIHTLEDVHAPELEGVRDGDHNNARFGPNLAAAITDQITRHQPRVAAVIGGNAHNMLALLRHPRPFDFRLSGAADELPIDPAAELVPEALLAAALAEKMRSDFARLRLLGALAGPFIQIESPPPLRDGDFIAAHAEAWFRNQGSGAIKVAPPGLRWRVWRLASRLMQEAAVAAGARFMPVPAEVQDADGFLRPEYAGDPTHGNETYGAVMIRALQDF